jgi:hypothetical protein
MKGWILFIALVGSPAVLAVQQPASAQAASVSGRVVDASTEMGIEGAIVVLRPSTGSVVRRVLADRNGQFTIGNLAAGTYQLDATASGYIDGRLGQGRPSGAGQPLQIAAGQKRNDTDVRLWRAASIAGRILDDAGQPVAGVAVTALLQRDFERAASSFGMRTATDDRGEYEIVVPPGSYVMIVQVMHMTWAADGSRGTVLPGTQWLRLHRVLADGRFSLRLDEGLESPASSTSKAPRTFVTTFYPSMSSARDAAAVVVSSGDVVTGIDIRLQTAPHRRVSGRAVDEQGQPLKQVVLRAVPVDVPTPPDGQDWSAIRAASSPDGAFSFLRIPPGSYTLEASRILGESDVRYPDPAGYWARMPLNVTDECRSDLSIATAAVPASWTTLPAPAACDSPA